MWSPAGKILFTTSKKKMMKFNTKKEAEKSMGYFPMELQNRCRVIEEELDE
jgi:hypothetical protein